jgi:CRP-like cAMP-binding protein
MKKLTLIDRAFLLEKTPLFSSLDLDALLPIADKLQQSTFLNGEIIFDVDERAERMYLIAEGEVTLFNSSNTPLAVLKAVDFFGDEALFNDQPRAYRAKASKISTLLCLTQTNLLTIISECPSVAVGLLQTYAREMPLRKWKT